MTKEAWMPRSNKKVAEVLRGALDILKRRGAWTQGALARTKTGELVMETDSEAVSFCAIGACYASMNALGYSARNVAIDTILTLDKATGESSTAGWNDDYKRRKKDVLAAFERAIQIAEGQEAAA